MNCQESRELMSGYLEQYLTESQTALVTEHLAGCAECRQELADLDETLRVVRGMPEREPVFDMWPELAAMCADIRMELRLNPADRVRRWFVSFILAFKDGWAILLENVGFRASRST